MKIKRFVAPDMRQAIQQVRQELGTDAVILSSRQADGGTELIAAVDYDEHLLEQMTPEGGRSRENAPPRWQQALLADPPPAAATHGLDRPDLASEAAPDAGSDRAKCIDIKKEKEGSAADLGSDPGVSPSLGLRSDPGAVEWVPDTTLAGMREELAMLRSMVHEQFRAAHREREGLVDPHRTLVARKLEQAGLAEALVAEVSSEIAHPEDPERAWRESLYEIARRIPIVREDPLEQGGVIALVGPTGVGKTTTIAKLAARYSLRYGRDSIALVSTDDYRVGAQRQLGAFGLILGIPVRAASAGAELRRVLDSLSDKRLVLVDTAGMSQRDERLGEEFLRLRELAQLRSLLVLAANALPQVLDEVVAAYGREHLAGAVITKMDEAPGLGAVLSTLIRERLPVAYSSEGQRVPEDLHTASIQRLVSKTLNRSAWDGVATLASSSLHNSNGSGSQLNAHV